MNCLARVQVWEFEDRDGQILVHSSLWFGGKEYQWALPKEDLTNEAHCQMAMAAFSRTFKQLP